MPNRTLAPSAWDRLKAKADELGGVGAGMLFEGGGSFDLIGVSKPICLAAIALDLGLINPVVPFSASGGAELFGVRTVDELDLAINRARAGHGWAERAPFEDVMAELGIERGVELETAAEAAAAEAIGDEEGGATDA